MSKTCPVRKTVHDGTACPADLEAEREWYKEVARLDEFRVALLKDTFKAINEFGETMARLREREVELSLAVMHASCQAVFPRKVTKP